MVDPSIVPLVPLRAGQASVDIPQIGFGVWQVSEAEIEPAVLEALRAGYRHIDTAKLYFNEEGVGRAVATAGLARDEVFITTKIWNNDHLQVANAFEASMARLGLKQLDLLLIHWPVPAAQTYVQAWKDLLSLREQGRVRAVGVSNFHVAHLQALHEATGEYPAINQIELHPYLQQNEIRAFCADHEIAIEAWSPLASGKRVLADPVINQIAATHAVSPAQVIIRWHLQLGNVVLPKSVTPARIAENIEVFSFSLSEAEMSEIEALDQGFRTGPNPDEFNLDAAR